MTVHRIFRLCSRGAIRGRYCRNLAVRPFGSSGRGACADPRIKIPGRLTENVSFSFFIHHFEAIAGISQGDEAGLDAAASGVPLRLDWWTNILEQEAADPVALITGLGYGRPLTNYVAGDVTASEGVQVREPHNSFLSVRLLLILGFVALILASTVGEDALEKPFNIVLFLGHHLAIGFQHKDGRSRFRQR
jgi:hypothetical protein